MADTKISALTAVATPAGTDEFPVNQGGTSKKVTLAQIVDHVGIRRLQRTLSAAEIKAASTPITLVAAPGAGFWIAPIYVGLTLKFTTPAYVVSGTAVLRLGTISLVGDLGAFLQNTSSVMYSAAPVAPVSVLTAAENLTLNFFTSVNPTNGNSVVAFDIFYAITPVPA